MRSGETTRWPRHLPLKLAPRTWIAPLAPQTRFSHLVSPLPSGLATPLCRYWQSGSPSVVDPAFKLIVHVIAVSDVVAVATHPVALAPPITTVIPVDGL